MSDRTKIKIAHVVERTIGGVGQFVKLLSEAQSADSNIAEVHFITGTRFEDGGGVCNNVTTHYYKSSRNPFLIFTVARNVHKILNSINPDVVILHSSFPGVYGRILSCNNNWRILYCAHGWSFVQEKNAFFRFMYKKIEKIMAYRTDAIINISHFENKAAKKSGVLARRNELIIHGVPDTKETGDVCLNIDNINMNYAFVGRMDYKKGIDILLDVFNCPEMEKNNLWVIGVSKNNNKCKCSYQKNIHFVGWVPNEKIDNYIKVNDAVIVPSRQEALGLTVLETMRNGRPVIASRAGGLAEILEDGVDGYYIDIENINSIRKMLLSLNKQKLNQLGYNARKKYEDKYTWERCYREWMDVITSVVSLDNDTYSM